jgi:histidinol phosphate phosphatase hisN-like protein
MEPLEDRVDRPPTHDARWVPGVHQRSELEAALLAGKVAGVAGHSADDVRRNAWLLLEGDPDKQFGLSGIPASLTLDHVLALVAGAAGSPVDRDRPVRDVWISPDRVLAAAEAMGDRLAEAARAGSTLLLATGHPADLVLLYGAIGSLAIAHGARPVHPAEGDSWREPGLDHDWRIAYRSGVGMVTDGLRPRHTHSPDPMLRMLQGADPPPGLVLADHGFAGAAIELGVPTVGIADVNDPALLVARSLQRSEAVICLDDHVASDAYWPVFQAVASRFPQSRTDGAADPS